MNSENENVTPNFLCIGAPKSGSTWLYDLLNSHSGVFLPTELKELRYFSRYYSRGPDWYKKLYKKCKSDQVAGDITPHYLYLNSCEHIKDYNKSFKLILIHRDPVKRCISHYKFRRRSDNYKKCFEDFLLDYPEAMEWGLYAKHLQKYLLIFPADQFLILNFDLATKDVDGTKVALAKFLKLDVNLFRQSAGLKKINAHSDPKFPRIYAVATRVSKFLAHTKLYRLRNRIKRLASFMLIGRESSASIPAPKQSTLDFLEDYYFEDQKQLDMIVQCLNQQSTIKG